jgi:DNA-binding GntR family transcriptional regulator
MGARRRETAYARIARELVDAITHGRIRVGQLLPTELELAQREGVSRHTAREALRRVESLGLVDRRRGAGTRVKAARPSARFHQAAQTIEDLLAYGMSTRLQLLQVRRRNAPRDIAALLGVAAGTPTVRIEAERVDASRERPLALLEVWVPAGSDIATDDLLDRRRSLPVILSRLDLAHVAKVEQVFIAGLADARTAPHLGCAPGDPVLVARRRYFAPDGGLWLLAISTHRADRYTYTHVLVREGAGG